MKKDQLETHSNRSRDAANYSSRSTFDPLFTLDKSSSSPVSTDGRGLSQELRRRPVKGDESAQRFLRGRFLREGATSRVGGVINVALRDATPGKLLMETG